MQDPALQNQSRGRPLTDVEAAFATALERIYETGCHDFTKVADELNSRGAVRPSGESGPWTVDVLQAELAEVNASLDAARAEAGIGA